MTMLGSATSSGPSLPSSSTATQIRSVTNETASETVVIGPDDSDCLDDDDNSHGNVQGARNTLGWPISSSAYLTRSSDQQVPQSASRPSISNPQPSAPLIEVAPRLYFATFDEPLPPPDHLNRGASTTAAVFPSEPPLSAGNHIMHAWHSVHPKGQSPRPGVVQGYAPTQPLSPQYHWATTELPYLYGNSDVPYEYFPFYDDWGPFNMSMLYLFCDHMASLMQDPDLKDHAIVLYTSSDPMRKTNTATLAALRSVLVLGMHPADAFYPFSTMNFQPWRDAGYGRADFCLTIQDVLYGAWKAQCNGLFDLTHFNLQEYFCSEQPQNGDWNWITPSFIAFASPNDPVYVKRLREGFDMPLTAEDQRKGQEWEQRKNRLVNDYARRNVQLVVRLNNPLYDKAMFEDAGMNHLDMYFDDGSNPSNEIIKDFIDRADQVVENGGVVAVHCKAGLGRTGVLIGAYLIWKYGFNAMETIGWMRLQRPGCVVGPQQHFIYEQANEWVKWGEQARVTKQADAKLAAERATMTRTIAQLKAQLVEARSQSASSAAALAKNKKRKSGGENDLGSARLEDDLDPSLVRPTKSQALQPRCTPQPPLTPGLQLRPHTPIEAPSTAARVKPTPCVGQPRKSNKRYVRQLFSGSEASPRRVSGDSWSSSSGLGSRPGSGLGQSVLRPHTSENPLSLPLTRPSSVLGSGPTSGSERRTKPELVLSGPGGSSSDDNDSAPTPDELPGDEGADVNNTPTRVNYSPSCALSRSESNAPAPPQQSPASKPIPTRLTSTSPVHRAPTPLGAQNTSPANVLCDSKVHNLLNSASTPKSAKEATFSPSTPTNGTPSTPTRNSIGRASPSVKARFGLKDAITRALSPVAPEAQEGAVIQTRPSPVRTRSRTTALKSGTTTVSPTSLFRPTITTSTARTTAQAVSGSTTDQLCIQSPPRQASNVRSGSTRPTTSRAGPRTASASSTGSAGSTASSRTRARIGTARAAAAKEAHTTAGFGRGRGPLTNRTAPRSAHPLTM